MQTQSQTGGFVGRFLTQALAGLALVAGAVLAVVFAASVALISLMAAALMGLAWMVMKARRPAPVPAGAVIEARRIGGHSWVAYGWDRQR